MPFRRVQFLLSEHIQEEGRVSFYKKNNSLSKLENLIAYENLEKGADSEDSALESISGIGCSASILCPLPVGWLSI